MAHKTNLTKTEVLHLLADNKDMIDKFGVKKIGIFGSVVRNEAKPESDLDIVVEFEKGKANFRNVGGLIEFLENLFGTEVDILTPDGIESIRIDYIKKKVKEEIEYVW